ncbi:unnamed protein product [Linum trigynum]|uniref:Uncharacterized protein n=1 Tax=Linum trigynum TaxID=586398 RepID=A0AAV2E7F2_9ROSI
MLTKTPLPLNRLFKEMAEQGYDWGTARRSRRAPQPGVHAVATQSFELVQVVSKLVSVLDRNGRISGRGQQQAMHCQWCESSHHTVEDCQTMRECITPQEQVNFINNTRRNDPYSNTYNEDGANIQISRGVATTIPSHLASRLLQLVFKTRGSHTSLTRARCSNVVTLSA